MVSYNFTMRAAVAFARLPSQNEKDAVARPDGWVEETHGKSADPDYDVVFPQDEVNRVDITIDPETWQAMFDDMTELEEPSDQIDLSSPAR